MISTSNIIAEPERADKTVADLSCGVAAELCELCAMVDQLQPVLSSLVVASAQPIDLGQYEKLQTLDYISQHLKGLEQFLKLVAGEADAARTTLDCRKALSAITLSDLRDRLIEAAASGFPPDVDDNDPDWELF